MPATVRKALTIFFSLNSDKLLTIEDWEILQDWFGEVYTDF